MISLRTAGLWFVILTFTASLTNAQHQPGTNCLSCHPAFKMGGTVYADTLATTIRSGVGVKLTAENGVQTILDNTNVNGNIVATLVTSGNYLITVGDATSRTWHRIPEQGSCNTCHVKGGNTGSGGTKKFNIYHTRIPPDNDCKHCHHFPASMSYAQLATGGVLNAQSKPPVQPGSRVYFQNQFYDFDPSQYQITTTRPDIFAPGFFSMFDAILAVANKNGIAIEYHYDDSCKTHWITKVNGVSAKYWYGFSYDAGSGNSNEMKFKRANRWDEALWRPGVWVQVRSGTTQTDIEQIDSIRIQYIEEIFRERTRGNIIPTVSIQLNPSNYLGNPPGSGRVTVSRTFTDIPVTAHNMRGTGYATPYSKPFRPGVITSIDILLSLKDQGHLNVVTGAFYSHFGGKYIDSYYVVEMGFPGIGVAHSSGRQGFTYTTENGTPNRLPNGADSKLHMTCDVNVIHAPDFSRWTWTQLGNPYYESFEPTSVLDQSVLEDYEAISRGFNLHEPYPNPFNSSLKLSFNIFETGPHVSLAIYSITGQQVAALYDGPTENLGISKFTWEPRGVTSGTYYVMMKYGSAVQMRRVVHVK